MSENTPWPGGYAAVNSFGFGGANVHVLLRSPNAPVQPPSEPSRPVLIPTTQRICPTTKEIITSDCHFATSGEDENNASEDKVPTGIPRLVVTAGRTEDAVRTLLEGVKERATPALCGLLDKLSDMPMNSLPARGYTIVDAEREILGVSITRAWISWLVSIME